MNLNLHGPDYIGTPRLLCLLPAKLKSSITPGQQRIVDMIPWSGQSDYRQRKWRD